MIHSETKNTYYQKKRKTTTTKPRKTKKRKTASKTAAIQGSKHENICKHTS
jgi:hypothetical protein